jgi:hypothetical protein
VSSRFADARSEASASTPAVVRGVPVLATRSSPPAHVTRSRPPPASAAFWASSTNQASA